MRSVSAAYSRRPSGTIALAAVVDVDRDRAPDHVLVDAPDRAGPPRRPRRRPAAPRPASAGPVASSETPAPPRRPDRRRAGPPGARGAMARRARDGPGTSPDTATATARATATRPARPGCDDPAATDSRRSGAGPGPPRRRRARSGSGSLCERRWVRFSTPALTRATLPSGATSDSRTDSVATGASTSTWTTTSGTPRTSSDRPEGRRCRSGRRPRPGGDHARGRSERRRRPTTGRRGCRRSADARRCRRDSPLVRDPAGRAARPAGRAPAPRNRGRSDRLRVRIAGRRAPPARGRRRERLGRRVLALEPDDRRLGVPAVVGAAQVSIEESGDLVQLVEVGARVRRRAATNAPSCPRACATAPGSGPACGTPGRHSCPASPRC